MKFSINGMDLANALKTVGGATSEKGTNAIARCVNICTIDNGLEFKTNNGDMSIKTRVPAIIEIEGNICVEYFLFNSLTKGLENEILQFETEDNTLNVRYKKSKIALQIIDEIMPEHKKDDNKLIMTISSQNLKDLIMSCGIAVAQDNSRPILKGVLFEVGQNSVNGVSLDGYRLMIQKREATCHIPNTQIVIDYATLNVVCKLIDNKDEQINIYTNYHYVTFEMPNGEIGSRLLDGDFIEYRRIMPGEQPISLIINKQELSNILQRVSQIAKGNRNNLVTFTISENEINVKSRSEAGTIDEVLECETQGGALTISFNAKFLLDFLKVNNDSFIKWSFTNNVSPTLLTAKENGTFIYLVLPVRGE